MLFSVQITEHHTRNLQDLCKGNEKKASTGCYFLVLRMAPNQKQELSNMARKGFRKGCRTGSPKKVLERIPVIIDEIPVFSNGILGKGSRIFCIFRLFIKIIKNGY